MNRNSILIPDQSIIIPTEADVMSMSAAPISRRNLIQRGGALAMAAPMGIVASSALLSTPAHAATLVVAVKSKIATFSKTMSGQRINFNVFNTTTAGQFLIVVNNETTRKVGVIFRNNSYTRVFNDHRLTTSGGVWRYTLTSEIGQIRSALIGSNIDNGRRLNDVNWGNPEGSSITERGDLSKSSDALTLFWETYRTRDLVVYSGAVLQKVSAAGNIGFTKILRFTGPHHNTFVNKRIAFTNAVNNMRAAQGRYTTTRAVAAVAVFFGLAGTWFSAGAGGAVVAGATATWLGNGVINGQAKTDALAVVATAWYDMVSWVEATTGENLVR